MNIDMDASVWKSGMDFFKALAPALQAPDWHSLSINPFLDSMIWGGINKVEPPYTVRIYNVAHLPHDVRAILFDLKKYLAEDRQEFFKLNGTDVEVEMQVFEGPLP